MKLKFNSSFLIAATILALSAIWLLSGQFSSDPKKSNSFTGNVEDKTSLPPTKVRVLNSRAFSYKPKIQVTGETQASREIVLRTQIAGKVKQINSKKGVLIAAGKSILQLEKEDYPDKVKEAEARVRQRELEFAAAKKLTKKGFRSETKYAESLANLQQARAMQKKSRQNLINTDILSPFEAIISDYYVEKGDVLKKGDPVAHMIDLEPILIKAFISEKHRLVIKPGATAYGILMNGTKRTGKIRYISPIAEKNTRTFKVEMEIANEDKKFAEGITAELIIPLPSQPAHRISAALFSLTSNGEVGIKVVDGNDIVDFLPVEILGGSDKEVVVGGLPQTLRVITVGQGFVQSGDKVQTFTEN
ncbi:MAG: efflux RND transporter periplasmic adaptor subunit [Pseudomonadota bacterium]|nr:efflux RND transporter periplasmic adaptor subunit [Pseudomonadota bacterium]